MCLRTSRVSWGGQGTAYPGSCRGSRPWRRAWRSQDSQGAASRAHSGVSKGLTSPHCPLSSSSTRCHSLPFTKYIGHPINLSLCCTPVHSWGLPDTCWEQSVFHHFLNVQSPDSTSHGANQTFPPNLPFQAQTRGTSVGVLKNQCYLVNHARFQFFFCDIIMAPLLVLQKPKQSNMSVPAVVTNAFMAEPQTSNAGI